MGEEQFVVPHRKRRRYSSFTGEICPEVPNLLGRDFHAEAESEMGNGLLGACPRLRAVDSKHHHSSLGCKGQILQPQVL